MISLQLSTHTDLVMRCGIIKSKIRIKESIGL